MSRPLRQFGISDLEAMYQGEHTDANTLARLEDELKHRQVPRAVALYNKVRAIQLAAFREKLVKHSEDKRAPAGRPAVAEASSAPQETSAISTSAHPAQTDLWAPPTSSVEAPAEFVTPVDTGHASPESRTPTAPQGSVNGKPTPSAQPLRDADESVEPLITLKEALAVFKTSPDASWATIELTRRTLVDLASPSKTKNLSAEDTRKALAKARQLNAAYLLLARNRCA